MLRNFPKSYNFHNRPVKVSKGITLNSNHTFVRIYKSTLEVKSGFIDPYFWTNLPAELTETLCYFELVEYPNTFNNAQNCIFTMQPSTQIP